MSPPPPDSNDTDSLPSPPKSLRMGYTIGRGEQGVLTFEPYKSYLLPHWRFRTQDLAQTSSQVLYAKFLAFHEARDFVGMDMARKFIQMGMTRSKRYANFKGGRKYEANGDVKENGLEHEGKEEKEKCSLIFKEVWERCKAFEGYKDLRMMEWEAEKREWVKNGMEGVDGANGGHVKREVGQVDEDEEEKPKSKGRKRVKVEK